METWLKKNFLFTTLLLLITLYAFWDIWSVFYQQDEWKVLGEYFAMNSFWEIFDRVNFFKAILGEGRVLSLVTGYFLLKGFPFETWPLALYSISFHFLNGILVFQLGDKLLGNKFYSLIAAIFFIVCAVSSSTVSWYSTSIGTLPATTLILVSILCFWEGINGKTKFLIWSFVLLLVSQLFKEIGYFLFPALPLSSVIFKRIEVGRFIKAYWYYLSMFLLIAVYRITQLNTYSAESAVFTQTGTHNFFLTIGLRFILYPFTSASLIFIPSEFLIRLAKIFTNHYYPFFPTEHYNLIVESAVLDLMAISLSFVILLLAFLLSIKAKRQIKENAVFILVLITTSYLPYIILSKAYAYLDSRYYYLGAAFSGIFLGFILMNAAKLFKNKFLKLLLIFAVFIYLSWQIQITKKELKLLSNLSIERKEIPYQISQIRPVLSDKNVFYITGDRHYYLAHGNYVPFQQGVGYTLIVWLNKDKSQFKEFLKNAVLWDLGSQGYFETGNNSFGYFWDEESFKMTIKEKKLQPGEITALYYDSKSAKLINITSHFIDNP